MRYARHRRKTWAERHEELAIAMIVLLTGVVIGLSCGMNLVTVSPIW